MGVRDPVTHTASKQKIDLLSYYLFIELDGATKIANAKHYLTEWFRSWTSLDEFKNITIGILHKGNVSCSTFKWTRLSSDIATLGTNVFNQFVNLKIPWYARSISVLR